MVIESCQNFRRDFTARGHREVAFCTVKGSDMNCGGMSDHCPILKYFKPEPMKERKPRKTGQYTLNLRMKPFMGQVIYERTGSEGLKTESTKASGEFEIIRSNAIQRQFLYTWDRPYGVIISREALPKTTKE